MGELDIVGDRMVGDFGVTIPARRRRARSSFRYPPEQPFSNGQWMSVVALVVKCPAEVSMLTIFRSASTAQMCIGKFVDAFVLIIRCVARCVQV